jgi:hypothetical protein
MSKTQLSDGKGITYGSEEKHVINREYLQPGKMEKKELTDTFLILVILYVCNDHRSNSDLCVSCKKNCKNRP